MPQSILSVHPAFRHQESSSLCPSPTASLSHEAQRFDLLEASDIHPPPQPGTPPCRASTCQALSEASCHTWLLQPFPLQPEDSFTLQMVHHPPEPQTLPTVNSAGAPQVPLSPSCYGPASGSFPKEESSGQVHDLALEAQKVMWPSSGPLHSNVQLMCGWRKPTLLTQSGQFWCSGVTHPACCQGPRSSGAHLSWHPHV